MPHRIQMRRTKGWRMPEGAVSVARPTRWGNPFVPVRQDGEWRLPASNLSVPAFCDDREDARLLAVSMFYRHLAIRRRPPPGWVDLIGYPSDDEVRSALAGKDLGCWCRLDAPGLELKGFDGGTLNASCHADVLLALANPRRDR
jgi:hypothetical protein